MDAVIGGKTYSFSKAADSGEGSYTVDCETGAITVPEGVKVQGPNGVVFTGEGSFSLSESGEGSTVVTVPEGASITGKGGATIAGGTAEVEIGSDGKLTLVEGQGSLSGDGSVEMQFTVFEDGASVTKTVKVEVSGDSLAKIGTGSIPDEVKTLQKGKSVTVGGAKYTVISTTSFPESGGNLITDGQKAVISGESDSDATVTFGEGESGIGVTVPKTNEGDTTLIKGSPNTVILGKTGDSFTVDEKTYIAGSDGSVFTINEDKNVTVETGSAVLGDGVSVIGGGSGKEISNPSGSENDKVTVETGNGKDIVTISKADGVVKIGGTEGSLYKAIEVGTQIEVTGEGNKLIGGTVEVGTGKEIDVGKLSVENTGGESKTIEVKSTGEGVGTITVPIGGKVKIGNAEIELDQGGTIEIGTDGKLEVTSGIGGSVKVGETTHTGPTDSRIKVQVNPEDGTSSSNADIIIEKLADGVQQTVAAGKSITIGKYVYTAIGQDVVLKGRADAYGTIINPEVILSGDNSQVKVALASDPNVNTTFTAADTGTSFAMSSDDTMAKQIDLLGGKVDGIAGATVCGGGNSITAVDASTVVGLTDEGNAVLVSGSGSSTGKMTATIGSVQKSFDGNGNRYTVDISTKKLTLNSGTEGNPASVEMDGSASLQGVKGQEFTLSNISDSSTTVAVPKGAGIIGKDDSKIESSASAGAKVQVEKSTGKLTLVDGTAKVSGSISVQGAGAGSDTVDVEVLNGGSCEVDTTSRSVGELSQGGSVVINGITYTTSDGKSKFPLDGGVLSRADEAAEVPAGKDASITLDGDEGTDPTVVVPSTNSGKTIVTKTGNGGTVTLEKVGDKFEVGGKTYAAGSDGATFSVDDSGNVRLISGSASLDDGMEITTDDGVAVTNPASPSGDKVIFTVDGGKDIVVIPSTGGAVKIGETEYTSAENDTRIEVTGSGNNLVEGSVLLDSGEGMTIGGVSIEGAGSPASTVASAGEGTGTVTVPQGGRVDINGAKIGGSDGDVVIDIVDGKTVVKISPGKKVTINGIDYEGGENGSTRTIGPDGQVVKGTVEIETGSDSSIEEEVEVGDTIKLPDETTVEPPKPQQVLVGWKTTDADGSETEYGIGSDYTVEGNVKVEAVYADASKVLVYTVDSNGGSVTGTTYEELDGSPVKLKEDGAKKEGYTFAGWKAKDGNDAVFAPGVSLDPTQTTYMEAYFIPNSAVTVTLTYDPEKGNGNVRTQTVEVGETVWLPTSLDMSRAGYRFVGWATESVTENTPATLGAESATAGRTMIKTAYYTVKESEVLYAVWEEESSYEPGWWDSDDDGTIWNYPTVVPSDGGSSDGSSDTKRIALIVAAVAVAVTEIAVLVAYRKK